MRLRVPTVLAAMLSGILPMVLANPRPLPPLELFFTESSRFAASLSPDGGMVAYLAPDERAINGLWIMDVDHPGTQRRLSPSEGVSVQFYLWVNASILLWQGDGPDGRARLHISNLTNGETRELLSREDRAVRLEGVVDSGNPCILIGISDEGGAYPDLFRLGLGKDEAPELACRNLHDILTWAWDAHGAPVAGLRWTDKGAKELLSLRAKDPRIIMRVEPADDLRLLMASRDGSQALVLTNHGGDLTRLEWVGLESGQRRTLAADPLNRVDLEGLLTAGDHFLAAGYSDKTLRWHALSPAFSRTLEKLEKDAAGDNLNFLGVDQSRSRVLFKRFSAVNPGSVWLHDSQSGDTCLLWSERPGLNADSLCETRAVEYPARDGFRIPAYLTLPKSGKPPWPMVVFPHGGPRMRTHDGFDGRVQFLASRGYVVLQPNFRGSRGYGKAFMNSGDGQWGRGVMQTDVTDGVDHFVSQGIAAPNRIAILGGSYGGYSALAGLAFTPERYAAGVCLFGISDLIDYASHHPGEWQAYAGDTIRRLGDPATAGGRKELRLNSPVNHAASFGAPLLIYHGAEDNLIPVSHAMRMVAALQQTGKSVDFLLGPDEAHGFSLPESEMAVYRAIELFLCQHLGGQAGLPPRESVSRRLANFRRAAFHKQAEAPRAHPP